MKMTAQPASDPTPTAEQLVAALPLPGRMIARAVEWFMAWRVAKQLGVSVAAQHRQYRAIQAAAALRGQRFADALRQAAAMDAFAYQLTGEQRADMLELAAMLADPRRDMSLGDVCGAIEHTALKRVSGGHGGRGRCDD